MLLKGGSVSISTDQIHFPRSFNYGQNEDFLKVFVLSYVKFLSDSPLHLSDETDKPLKAYYKFFNELVNTNIIERKKPDGSGVNGLIKRYSDLSDLILSNEYSSGSDSTTRVYHKAMEKTPVFKEYLSWLRGGEPPLLSYVLSFLRFGKKLEFIDESLNAVAFRDWLGVEEKLSTLKFSEVDMLSMSNIIRELVLPLQPTNPLPKFGTGKVADAGILDVYDKLATLKVDRKLSYAFQRSTQFNLGGEGLGLVKDLALGNDSTDRIARLKFVPKDVSKARSICMEPNHYMYFQQEVLRWIVDSMDRSPLRRFVDLRDQSRNREAARHGSQYLSMDTIDLSSASDSVHADLVRRTFPRDWRFYMFATRTSRVKCPDGKVRSVNKFAPMGSAICFPTQCILFTAACIYASGAHMFRRASGSWVMTCEEARTIIRQFAKLNPDFSPFGKRLESPLVYGDDIICDSRVTGELVILLERLGFVVNGSKSFTKSQSFRESCGVYCYEGSDVTPVLFRIPFLRRGRWDAKVYASLIENINYVRGKGYHALASFWLSLLRGYGFRYPLPFVGNTDAFGLFTVRKHGNKPKAPAGEPFWTHIKDRKGDFLYRDPHLRWNLDWQTYEEQVQGIGPKVSRRKAPSLHEKYRLDQWWRSRISGGTTPPNTRGLTIRPQETRLVPTWARYE